MKLRLLTVVAVLIAAACSATSAGAASTPTPSQVWAKVRAVWTAQARSHGWQIKCRNPMLYHGRWLMSPACYTPSGAGLLGQSTACLYDVSVAHFMRLNTSAHLDVCKPGWLAALPRIDS
jgi:hypothetical protein